MADIPAGTGLGSSGAFAVGLVKALLAYQHRFASNADIAEIACHLEIERLGEPIGKQDQYIAALGGITALEFRTDNTVVAHPISMADGLRQLLQENLLLFYTGVRRSASDELRALDGDAKLSDSDMTKNLDEVKQSGYRSAEALERGDLDPLAVGGAPDRRWLDSAGRRRGRTRRKAGRSGRRRLSPVLRRTKVGAASGDVRTGPTRG
jgi:D-glycero-alpha-D-manno-heptose-7-phosphate kinase